VLPLLEPELNGRSCLIGVRPTFGTIFAAVLSKGEVDMHGGGLFTVLNRLYQFERKYVYLDGPASMGLAQNCLIAFCNVLRAAGSICRWGEIIDMIKSIVVGSRRRAGRTWRVSAATDAELEGSRIFTSADISRSIGFSVPMRSGVRSSTDGEFAGEKRTRLVVVSAVFS
jgi:hypothetical protein